MKARQVEGLDPRGTFRSNIALIAATRLEELDDLAPAALDPAAETAQHAMRIAAKRLRYVLEVGAACMGAPAEAARDVARSLQDVLGEIHDCDVMMPRVAGVESAESLLRTRRELLFARFRELWRAEETQRALHGPFATVTVAKGPGGG
jgi:CHAD domain-containing protein